MTKLNKQINDNCKKLSSTEKKMEDIYNIIFSFSDNVMVEYPTMTRKLTYTYATVKEYIHILAKGIVSTLGCCDRYLGIYGENSLEWIVMFFAVLESGNKPFLINLRQPLSFSGSILKSIDAFAVITLDKNVKYDLTVYDYNHLFEAGKNAPETAMPAFGNELALSTNGTTLKEKVCFYTGEQLAAQIVNVPAMARENPMLTGTYKGRLTMLAFLPMYHIFGLEAMFLWYAFFGATFVFLPDFQPETILRTVRNHNVTHIFAVPALWHAIEKSVRREVSRQNKTEKFEKALKLSLKLQDMGLGRLFIKAVFGELREKLLGPSPRFLISGGSYINQSALTLINGLGYSLSNGYGMTEIGICSVELSKKASVRNKGSVGRGVASVEYSIGADSRLLVKGTSLSKAVLTDNILSENNGWFDTGDIVHRDDSGRYYIDGRISDIVLSADGENLNPDLAEKAFRLDDALELTVMGNKDNSHLMLIVRIRPDLLQLEKDRLKEQIRFANEALPPAYRVHKVKFTFDPLSAQQAIKVSRAYVRKAISENKIRLFDIDGAPAPNEEGVSEIKAVLRTLFASALGVTEAEITDDGNFMTELNGTSLDYFALISSIDERFGVMLDFESDSCAYSVNGLEAVLKEKLKK